MTQIGWAKVKVEPTKEAPFPFNIASFHEVQGSYQVHFPNGGVELVTNGEHATFVSTLKIAGFEILCDGPGDSPPIC